MLLQSGYIIFALIAVAVFTTYIAVVSLFRKDPIRERIKQVVPVDLPGGATVGQESVTRSGLAILCGHILTLTGVDLAKARRDLYVTLWRAGCFSQDAIAYYLFFQRFIQPVLFIIGLYVFWRMLQLPPETDLSQKLVYVICGGILLVLGAAGARLYIHNRTQKRQAIIQKTFPDMLDLLLICVEAGQPLDSALARVCREMKTINPAMTAELDLTRIELNVRHDRTQALQNLADRTGTSGFRMLATALIQSEQFGTSIADTLRTMADEHRTTRQYTAENKAARIPALITIPIIFFFIIPIFVVILGPPIIQVQQQGGLFGNGPKSSASRR